jgi:hypothetical protein
MKNTFRRLKCDSELFGLVLINGEKHREYTISDLPAKFGCMKFGENGSQGIDKWYTNHATGLTYVSVDYFGDIK